MPGELSGRSIRESERRWNGSYVPWNEDGSLVPVLERFLPFRDEYIQRFQMPASRAAVAGESNQTD
jgi:hypothetical protein